MKSSHIAIIVVVVLIIVGLAGWYAYSNPHIAAALGLRPAPTQQTTASSTPGNYARVNPGFAIGSIETLNGNSFTITLANGNTKDVDITGTTSIQNYATASSTPTTVTPDQLNVGEQVFVMGTPNPDGSITAERIRTGTIPTVGQGHGPYRGANGQVPPPTAD